MKKFLATLRSIGYAGLAWSVLFSLTSTSASAAIYYVSKTGNNNNPGTAAAPFQTLNYAVSRLSAGDTLWVRAGVYNEVLQYNIPSGTSWANKVRIAAYGSDGPSRETVWLAPTPFSASAVIAFAGNLDGGSNGSQSYIEVDGLNTTLATITTVGGTNIKIEAGSDGTNVWHAHHIRIKNSEHIGSKIAFGNIFSGTGGILLTETGAGTFLGSNELLNLSMHSSGNATTVGVTLYIQSDNNVIDGIDIYDTNDGIQLNNAYMSANPPSGNVIRNFRVHDLFAWNDGRVYGFIDTGNGNTYYNGLIYNFSDTAARGIYLFGSNGAFVYNITVTGIGGYGILVDPGMSATIRNVIAYNNTTNFLDNGGGARSNNLFGVNPLFVNAAAGNFQLLSGSPGINAGTTVPLVSSDFVGVSRPQGSDYDIGAYESGSTSTTTCDVNQDGPINVSDVQLSANQAIGSAACLPAGQAGSADINRDGQCNVIDVQRVVNAALGGSCVSP